MSTRLLSSVVVDPTILPTLHCAFPNLTTLVICIEHAGANIGDFFEASHFPNLQEFSLEAPRPRPDPSRAFVCFLERHAPTLVVLHLLSALMAFVDGSDLRLPLEMLHIEHHSLWALAPAVRGTVATLCITRCIHRPDVLTCKDIFDKLLGSVRSWPSVRRLAMQACLRYVLGQELVPTSSSKISFPIEIRQLSVVFPNLETLHIDAGSEVSGSRWVAILHYRQSSWQEAEHKHVMSMLKKAAGDLAACRKLKCIVVFGFEGLIDCFEPIRSKKPALGALPAYHCESFDSWPSVPLLRPQQFNWLNSLY